MHHTIKFHSSDLVNNAPLKSMHNLLMSLFVDRFELEDRLFNESKKRYQDSWKDVAFTKESREYEYCCLMHIDWKEFERMAIANKWKDLFIEDGGINNAW